jgi:hypothetical protein
MPPPPPPPGLKKQAGGGAAGASQQQQQPPPETAQAGHKETSEKSSSARRPFWRSKDKAGSEARPQPDTPGHARGRGIPSDASNGAADPTKLAVVRCCVDETLLVDLFLFSYTSCLKLMFRLHPAPTTATISRRQGQGRAGPAGRRCGSLHTHHRSAPQAAARQQRPVWHTTSAQWVQRCRQSVAVCAWLCAAAVWRQQPGQRDPAGRQRSQARAAGRLLPRAPAWKPAPGGAVRPAVAGTCRRFSLQLWAPCVCVHVIPSIVSEDLHTCGHPCALCTLSLCSKD